MLPIKKTNTIEDFIYQVKRKDGYTIGYFQAFGTAVIALYGYKKTYNTTEDDYQIINTRTNEELRFNLLEQ
tara:strand:+ start:229 stop:441 length:213 start_codon:yes stop_codon:yes gene_type:complete